MLDVFEDARVEGVSGLIGVESVQENLVEAAEFGFRSVDVERVVVSNRRWGFFVRALLFHRGPAEYFVKVVRRIKPWTRVGKRSRA